MKNKKLLDRWLSFEGSLLLQGIITSLKNGMPLSSLKGIEKYAGRWDLRGTVLCSLSVDKEIKSGKNSFTQKTGSLVLKNYLLEAIDFSFADLSHAKLTKCTVNNCLFDHTNFKEATLKACDITDCIFQSTNLSYSFLNLNIGSNSGSFANCLFKEANLTEAIFNFPTISNCLFEDCRLITTVFDGSRFANSKFTGVVQSPLFMGYSVYARKSNLRLFNKIEPRDYPNKMYNVDFSNAKLIGASFTHGVNLINCNLPKGEEYIIIENLETTMKSARNVIATEWQGESKRLGIVLIDKVYFKKNKHGIGRSIINTSPISFSSKEIEVKFFSLIRELNNCS